MRFRIDGADDMRRPHPSHLDSKPGPHPHPEGLDHHQRIEYLRRISDGVGPITACTQLGISVRALKRSLDECPSFRRAVEQLEQIRSERLCAVLYAAALNGDTRAALYLLARYDYELERRNTGDET